MYFAYFMSWNTCRADYVSTKTCIIATIKMKGFNPQRTCAARVMVLGLCVCVCVCLSVCVDIMMPISSDTVRILTKKGAHWVHDTAGGSGHNYTTIHRYGSASRVRLPPFIVYKGKYLYSAWTRGGPAGAMYAVNRSDWMKKKYESWMKKMFLPATSHSKTKCTCGPVFWWSPLTHQYLHICRKSKFIYAPPILHHSYLTTPRIEGIWSLKAGMEKQFSLSINVKLK